MKKIIQIFILSFIVLNGYMVANAAQYVHISKPWRVLNQLPQAWDYLDGTTSNGNFRQLAERKPQLAIDQGFRKITVDNTPAYDSRIQSAGGWQVTIVGDHAERTRNITNIPIPTLRKAKRKQILAEGQAILDAKYDSRWQVGYDADETTLRNYWRNTIKPLLVAAAQASDAVAIVELTNDPSAPGGADYTWPEL